jgi:type IV pilus secretin PilQ/predicted competence protein
MNTKDRTSFRKPIIRGSVAGALCRPCSHGLRERITMRSSAGRSVSLWLACLVAALFCSSAWAAAPGKITGVSLDAGSKQIVISSKGAVGKHTARVIGRPNRLVIDFNGATLGKIPRRIKGGSHQIHEIRVGHYKSRARVVVDFLGKPVPGFQVRRDSGRIVVALGKSLSGSLPGPNAPGTDSAKKPGSSPLAPNFVRAAAGPSGAESRAPRIKRAKSTSGGNLRITPTRLSAAKAKSAQDAGPPKLTPKAEANRPSPSRPFKRTRVAANDTGPRPAVSSFPVSSQGGASRNRRRMVRNVRPPVTPPTPDPRLVVQEITELKFIQVGHNSRLIIRGGDNLDYRLNKVSPTKVRIDLINAEILKTHQKPLRTDLFSTSVEMIVPGTQTIFVQLKDAVPYQVQKKKGVLMIDFPPPRMALTSEQAAELGVGDLGGRAEYKQKRGESVQRQEATRIMMEETIRQANETRERQIRAVQKELDELLKERREIERKYRITPDPEIFSKPVTMDFQGISLRNAFRLLAEQAGINIIVGAEVSGATTMRLFQVPLGQVIDTILETHNLDRELIGNVMRIGTREKIAKSKTFRLKEHKVLLEKIDRDVKKREGQIKDLKAEREKALETLATEQKKAEEPPEDITSTETVGQTETIDIDGEPVTLVLVRIKLSYAEAPRIRTILNCVFNRVCEGGDAPASLQQTREERQYERFLSSQGFQPGSPGAQARLLTFRRDQRGERRTEAAEAIAQQAGGPQARGALREDNLDPKMKKILAHTVMWADQTYNTLFIKDLPARLEEMKKLIATLDVPVPQALIEARMVLADRSWSRGLGVLWGGRNNQVGPIKGNATGNPRELYWGVAGNQAVSGANAATGQTTQGNNIPSSFAVNLPAVVAGLGNIPGFGMQFGLLQNDFISELDVRLQLGEANGKAKTISQPKVQVLDGESANIKNGRTIAYSTVSADGTQTQLVNVDLELDVSPTIFPDGRIEMDVNVTDNDIGDIVNGQASILNREASTILIVKDGETAVIGGILRRGDTTSRTGLTGLMNVPLLNYLFSGKNQTKIIQELLIFITPTIVKRPPPAS